MHREQMSVLYTVVTRVWDEVESQATQRDLRGVDHCVAQLEAAGGLPVPLDVRDVDLVKLTLTSAEGAAAAPVARP